VWGVRLVLRADRRALPPAYALVPSNENEHEPLLDLVEAGETVIADKGFWGSRLQSLGLRGDDPHGGNGGRELLQRGVADHAIALVHPRLREGRAQAAAHGRCADVCPAVAPVGVLAVELGERREAPRRPEAALEVADGRFD